MLLHNPCSCPAVPGVLPSDSLGDCLRHACVGVVEGHVHRAPSKLVLGIARRHAPSQAATKPAAKSKRGVFHNLVPFLAVNGSITPLQVPTAPANFLAQDQPHNPPTPSPTPP